MLVLDAQDVVELLRCEVERAGGPAAFARKASLDRATVHRTLQRQNRPGSGIIGALDLCVVYAPRTGKSKTNGAGRKPGAKPALQDPVVPRATKGSDIAIVRPGPRHVRSAPLLRLNGRSVRAPRAHVALLACLFNDLGHVVPYERLCAAIGHHTVQDTQLHILRQHMGLIRRMLNAHKVHYVVAVAHGIGYALCEMSQT